MKPLSPNTMIQGRYLVVHLIGKGGMGEVYLAVDQRLGSAVALKRTSFADDQMLATAFEREAKILARLRHPVLPKVSDHFSENGELYLVMEHISGDDLSKRLENAQKAFPVSWVMFWADQLLDALSYLHSHEPPIIHRDIKPQNLKLTDENHIVLLDFGLSKDTANQSIVSAPGKSGSVVGYTPHFAPMEQIRGTGTNPRSDIYSLSATLYQLMTNTVPADALTRADLMLSSQTDPIRPLSDVNPEISPAVSNVILKGLEVSQEKRFATAAEMQKSLRAAYAQMQGQMSAQTVAFNIGDQAGADLHSTTPPIDSGRSVAPSEFPTAMPSRPNTEAPTIAAEPVKEAPSMEATIQMDAPQIQDAVRQSDLKTEVFLASDLASSDTAPSSSPFASENHEAGQPSSPASGSVQSFDPAATVPFINYDAASEKPQVVEQMPQNMSAADTPATPEFFQTAAVANVGTAPEPAPTPIVQAAPQAQAASPGPQKPPKKKSGAILILLLLGFFFIIIAAAAGGGYYYYTNYMGGTVVKPSPSPTATPVATPSATPEPTVEPTPGTNSNTSTNGSNSNTNSLVDGSNTSTVPTPQTTPATTKPTPQVDPTKGPVVIKPAATPAVKPTPKPKPSNDRTVILQ